MKHGQVVFSQKSSKQPELVKENKVLRAPLSGLWVLAALAASAATLAAVARIDHALPAPLGPDAPPARFHALTAHRHLVNLTALGPRVAGSYENEVLAVGVLVSALRHIAAHASPHNRVELDVHTASGAFPLAFMDGMSNVYRGVQSVVARVSGAGGKARARSALLLNCHFDSVPDSPAVCGLTERNEVLNAYGGKLDVVLVSDRISYVNVTEIDGGGHGPRPDAYHLLLEVS